MTGPPAAFMGPVPDGTNAAVRIEADIPFN